MKWIYLKSIVNSWQSQLVAFIVLLGLAAIAGFAQTAMNAHPSNEKDKIAESKTSDNGMAKSGIETAEQKIDRAISAGPENISKSARIIDTDAQGDQVILREGSNGFTCMPGNPNVVGEPPMCADAASMQWFGDAKAHKPKPTNTIPGITYMLAGATQRSDSDPYDTTSPPITVGPHWMIMWPFDPKTTGLPTTHRPTGAYIMWAGSPYAHVHIMGRP
jgi:hypothetical protein